MAKTGVINQRMLELLTELDDIYAQIGIVSNEAMDILERTDLDKRQDVFDEMFKNQVNGTYMVHLTIRYLAMKFNLKCDL